MGAQHTLGRQESRAYRCHMQSLSFSGESMTLEHSFLPAGMFVEPCVGRMQMPGVQMEGSGSLGWYTGF